MLFRVSRYAGSTYIGPDMQNMSPTKVNGSFAQSISRMRISSLILVLQDRRFRCYILKKKNIYMNKSDI